MPEILIRRHVEHIAEDSKASEEHHPIHNRKANQIEQWRQSRHERNQEHVLPDDPLQTHGYTINAATRMRGTARNETIAIGIIKRNSTENTINNPMTWKKNLI